MEEVLYFKPAANTTNAKGYLLCISNFRKNVIKNYNIQNVVFQDRRNLINVT